MITLALPHTGPRMTAAAGALVAGVSAGVFCRLDKNAPRNDFMVAYGMLAVGMNSVYVALMAGMVGMFKPGDLQVYCRQLNLTTI